jgi:hypothetical protein
MSALSWSRTPEARAMHLDRMSKHWVRWLALGCALPLEHVAAVLEVDLAAAAAALVHREGGRGGHWVVPTAPPIRSSAHRLRQIHGPLATKIIRLQGLSYPPATIATILDLRRSTVLEFLRRCKPIRRAALVRPRSRPEQKRIRPPRSRPWPSPAPPEIPANELWRHGDGPSPSDPQIVLPAVDQVELEPPLDRQPWDGPTTLPGMVSGESHGRAKLTWKLVREIRRQHAAGWTCARLARICGVTPGTISAVVKHQTWVEHGSLPCPAADCPENGQNHRENGDS